MSLKQILMTFVHVALQMSRRDTTLQWLKNWFAHTLYLGEKMVSYIIGLFT